MGTPDFVVTDVKTLPVADRARILHQRLHSAVKTGTQFADQIPTNVFAMVFGVPQTTVALMEQRRMSLVFVPQNNAVRVMLPAGHIGPEIAQIYATDDRKRARTLENWYSRFVKFQANPQKNRAQENKLIQIMAWGLGLVWFDPDSHSPGIFDFERSLNLSINSLLREMTDQIEYYNGMVGFRDHDIIRQNLWDLIGEVDFSWQRSNLELEPKQIMLAATGSAAHS